ncbi:MAG: hypothetical protein RBT36_07900, partial [Desulfobulbus sp.]|nr:hypothetical protein [Desulfobulbus sp.]
LLLLVAQPGFGGGHRRLHLLPVHPQVLGFLLEQLEASGQPVFITPPLIDFLLCRLTSVNGLSHRLFNLTDGFCCQEWGHLQEAAEKKSRKENPL